jgi:uncharacterized protein
LNLRTGKGHTLLSKSRDDALIPDKRCVLLFVKCPVKGMVKSRLAKDIDEDLVLSLYKHFVLDLLKTLGTTGYPLRICFFPPDAFGKVSAWLGKGYSYLPQKGKDLGERMKNAFLEIFSSGFTRVLLIGSDIPDLTSSTIDEAFDLEHFDAVIGPSFDGGYYLIGFKQNTFTSAAFGNIHWGSDRVFGETMALLLGKRYAVRVLPEKRDIDRLEDLRAFAEYNRETESADSGTMLYIRKNFKTLFGEATHP